MRRHLRVTLATAALLLTATTATGCSAATAATTPTPSVAAVAPQLYLVAPDGEEWTAAPVNAGQDDPDPRTAHRFPTQQAAIDWAAAQDSTYGVRVAPAP